MSKETGSDLPIVIPDRPTPMQLFFVDQIRQQDPQLLEETPDAHGQLVYHELLQKILVDWIAMRHFGHWRMELLQFEAGPGGETQSHFSPMPDASQEASKVLSGGDVQQIFSQNRFAGVHSGFGKLALPPGTTLSIETPREASGHGEIRFKNLYAEITIRTSPGLGLRGLGAYSTLLDISPSTPGYWTQQYIVRVRATFTPWLVGHPRMALIKQWATGILNGLQNEFDEQVVWRKTIENYTLRQHLAAQGKSIPLPFGPMRAVPPAEKEKSD